MSEMVDEVAKAIENAIANLDLRACPPDYWSIARAAITAMRDPTFEMLTSGIDHPSDDIKLMWQAMIDEALK